MHRTLALVNFLLVVASIAAAPAYDDTKYTLSGTWFAETTNPEEKSHTDTVSTTNPKQDSTQPEPESKQKSNLDRDRTQELNSANGNNAQTYNGPTYDNSGRVYSNDQPPLTSDYKNFSLEDTWFSSLNDAEAKPQPQPKPEPTQKPQSDRDRSGELSSAQDNFNYDNSNGNNAQTYNGPTYDNNGRSNNQPSQVYGSNNQSPLASDYQKFEPKQELEPKQKPNSDRDRTQEQRALQDNYNSYDGLTYNNNYYYNGRINNGQPLHGRYYGSNQPSYDRSYNRETYGNRDEYIGGRQPHHQYNTGTPAFLGGMTSPFQVTTGPPPFWNMMPPSILSKWFSW